MLTLLGHARNRKNFMLNPLSVFITLLLLQAAAAAKKSNPAFLELDHVIS
jgi:hypothetical protein